MTRPRRRLPQWLPCWLFAAFAVTATAAFTATAWLACVVIGLARDAGRLYTALTASRPTRQESR